MNPEFIVGRPVDSVSDASARAVEFLIMEAMLEHLERMLAEIVHNMYCMSKWDASMLWKAFFIT